MSHKQGFATAPLPPAVQEAIRVQMVNFGEIPDRTSPEDFPEGYVLTREEIVDAFVHLIEVDRATRSESATPAGWTIGEERDGLMVVSGPLYRTQESAESDAKLPRARGVKAEVYACVPATRSAIGTSAQIEAEVERAVAKFPTWPTDPLHALAVLGEEYGELTKAMLQLTYEPHKSTAEEVRKEALQTAAMALRLFRSLDRYEYKPGVQHEQ